MEFSTLMHDALGADDQAGDAPWAQEDFSWDPYRMAAIKNEGERI